MSLDTDGLLALLQDVAARVITPRFRALADGEVHEKKPGDFVTIADHESEDEITKALEAAFPGALVVGEEATFANPGLLSGLSEAEHAFVVDPVDGTRNFVRGNPDHAVMLAEVRAGRTTRGWIWQPEHELAVVGELGSGVWWNGERLQPVARGERPRVETSIKAVQRLDSTDLAGVGTTRFCCGVDYPRLLAGDNDVLAYGPPKPWDHLAGTLFVRETGGIARTSDGREYGPASAGRAIIVAADQHSYDIADTAIGDRIRR